MTEEELEISRSTPTARFDQPPPSAPKKEQMPAPMSRFVDQLAKTKRVDQIHKGCFFVRKLNHKRLFVKIGLFYGSTTCYTEMAAEKIQTKLAELNIL